MSIKVSFSWFLWLQHLALSFFQKSFEKLIRVKTPSKWRDADLKLRPLDRFRLYRAGYLHYLFLTRIPNKTQNIKWFLLCKCNGIYYDCRTVNRTFKMIAFICTWTVSKTTSEKNTNDPFCLCTWRTTELAMIYGFSLPSLLKLPTAEFTTSNDNSPKYFFVISENADYNF